VHWERVHLTGKCAVLCCAVCAVLVWGGVGKGSSCVFECRLRIHHSAPCLSTHNTPPLALKQGFLQQTRAAAAEQFDKAKDVFRSCVDKVSSGMMMMVMEHSQCLAS